MVSETSTAKWRDQLVLPVSNPEPKATRSRVELYEQIRKVHERKGMSTRGDHPRLDHTP